jgi:hypothetical protein
MNFHIDLLKLTIGYVENIGQQFPARRRRGAAEKKKKSLEKIEDSS